MRANNTYSRAFASDSQSICGIMKPLHFGILKRLQSMSVLAHTVRLVAQSRISFVHFRSLSVILNRKRFSGRFTFILGSETKSLRSTDWIRIRAVRLVFPLPSIDAFPEISFDFAPYEHSISYIAKPLMGNVVPF